MINGSATANKVRSDVVSYMKDKLVTKPDLLSQILPTDFGIGCRRQTFAHGYLEALTSAKTTTFTSQPLHFTSTGIVDHEGTEHELDMVIAATGYDQSHLPRYPKLVNGENMSKKWQSLSSPPSYMAVMLSGMPNYFNPSSAYGPLPQGNYYQSSECFVLYIISCIHKMQIDRIVSIVPKPSAVDHWVRHANAWLKRTAMSGNCVSWYKGNDAAKPRAPALWPGARSQFLKVMESPRFEDFEIVYEDQEDTFAFMGNGWTVDVDAVGVGEEEGTGGPTEGKVDTTWYMGTPEREIGEEVLEKLRGVYGDVVVPGTR